MTTFSFDVKWRCGPRSWTNQTYWIYRLSSTSTGTQPYVFPLVLSFTKKHIFFTLFEGRKIKWKTQRVTSIYFEYRYNNSHIQNQWINGRKYNRNNSGNSRWGVDGKREDGGYKREGRGRVLPHKRVLSTHLRHRVQYLAPIIKISTYNKNLPPFTTRGPNKNCLTSEYYINTGFYRRVFSSKQTYLKECNFFIIISKLTNTFGTLIKYIFYFFTIINKLINALNRIPLFLCSVTQSRMSWIVYHKPTNILITTNLLRHPGSNTKDIKMGFPWKYFLSNIKTILQIGYLLLFELTSVNNNSTLDLDSF